MQFKFKYLALIAGLLALASCGGGSEPDKFSFRGYYNYLKKEFSYAHEGISFNTYDNVIEISPNRPQNFNHSVFRKIRTNINANLGEICDYNREDFTNGAEWKFVFKNGYTDIDQMTINAASCK